MGWLASIAIFSQHVRDGVQNRLCVLNLIYSAHNGRGVGLTILPSFYGKIALH